MVGKMGSGVGRGSERGRRRLYKIREALVEVVKEGETFYLIWSKN